MVISKENKILVIDNDCLVIKQILIIRNVHPQLKFF